MRAAGNGDRTALSALRCAWRLGEVDDSVTVRRMNPATASRPAAASAVVARPSYKWQVVAMLWFVCFFNYADRQSIFSVFPKLRDEFGFDTARLGLIGSAFMWVYAAGAPFA